MGTLVTTARTPLIIVMSGEGITRLGTVVVLGETKVLLEALCVALGIAATEAAGGAVETALGILV